MVKLSQIEEYKKTSSVVYSPGHHQVFVSVSRPE